MAAKADLWLRWYYLTQILLPVLQHQQFSSEQFEVLAVGQNIFTMSQKYLQRQTLNGEIFSLVLINVVNCKQALKMEGVRQSWAGFLVVTGISPASDITQVSLQ